MYRLAARRVPYCEKSEFRSFVLCGEAFEITLAFLPQRSKWLRRTLERYLSSLVLARKSHDPCTESVGSFLNFAGHSGFGAGVARMMVERG